MKEELQTKLIESAMIDLAKPKITSDLEFITTRSDVINICGLEKFFTDVGSDLCELNLELAGLKSNF